jgi:hypothetical protein
MKQRSVVSLGVLLIAVGLFWPAPAAGQNTGTQAQPGGIARTPDGKPDLQGLWLFFNSSPLETPGTPTRRRAGETRENAGAQDALQDVQIDRRERTRGEVQVNPFYSEGPLRSRQVRRQPSLVVEPADGKVPVLDSAVEKNNHRLDHFYDSYVYLNPAERCITYGVPGSQFPSINASVTIVQSPGYVGFVNEMNGARIVPVDGSSHLPQSVRLWNGDSRGRWEGNTLVIEVTNYNDRGTVTHSPDRLQGITHSEALRVVERYTPVDANTINYEVTIEDPNTYSAPWKAAFPLMRDDGSYKVFEYVCHEGNERFMNIVLGGGRLMDKGAGAEAAIASPSRKAAGEAGQALGK